MTDNFRQIMAVILLFSPLTAVSIEESGTGSMISGPLMREWGAVYTKRSPGNIIHYKGSSPADGIKQLLSNNVGFSSIDMPLSASELKKNGLIQFPFVLGGISPVVNLPKVYPGQFRLDGQTLGDIFLGIITKWNDPAIVALNPESDLPDEYIIIVHRVSPPGISTIVGDYLAKTHTHWKEIKGDGMAGKWPDRSIEVNNPIENIEKIKKTPFSIGYGPMPHIMKNKLSYIKMKNRDGNYISPSDENISEAAVNAKWNETNGFDVVLTDQPGASSWPLSMASYVLLHKVSEHPEKTKELLKYFKYSLRFGGLLAIQNDYVPVPDSLRGVIQSSWEQVVDAKGNKVF